MGDGAKEPVEMAGGTQGPPPHSCHPLTLHVEGDEGLGVAGRTAGVADVLARVLLRGTGDDQAAVHHAVLPGQWRPQLRPLHPWRRLPCGQHRRPSPRRQPPQRDIPSATTHPVPVAVQCSVAVSPATTVMLEGAVTWGAPGCRCAVSTVTSTRACAEPRALCAVQT